MGVENEATSLRIEHEENVGWFVDVGGKYPTECLCHSSNVSPLSDYSWSLRLKDECPGFYR